MSSLREQAHAHASRTACSCHLSELVPHRQVVRDLDRASEVEGRVEERGARGGGHERAEQQRREQAVQRRNRRPRRDAQEPHGADAGQHGRAERACHAFDHVLGDRFWAAHFAGQNDPVGRGQRFAGNTRQRIRAEIEVDNRIGNSVGNLVGMSFRNGFTSK